jgi:hypothetical protein
VCHTWPPAVLGIVDAAQPVGTENNSEILAEMVDLTMSSDRRPQLPKCESC